jgi:hypothetical protein
MMGHPESPYAKACIMVTDSTYVAVSMRIMTRIGSAILDKLRNREDFIKGFHSIGSLDPNRRYIMHFPRESLVWSVGSGYGGNALLGKKCVALRIASYLGYKQGWLAEHMVIMGIEDSRGRTTYITAALPSACGKTNLAMMESALPGYRVWTLGDDIAWLNIGPDGRLWAINPEAGYFGVAPGTSMKTPWAQLKLSVTRGMRLVLRPPKMMAEMGTPWGLSACLSSMGEFTIWAVNREFGWAALVPSAGVQGRPCQSRRFSGTGPSRPSHHGSLASVSRATLVKRVGLKAPRLMVFIDVPGATPKYPASGLMAQSRPSGPMFSQAMSSPSVQTR